jgi:two-component system, chemotaxis family, CheB/CheR fusion protein
VLPYRSVDNYIGGTVVTFTDMTPLTRAQQALRESEERFRAIVTQSTIGIAETRNGSLVYVNQPFCAMMGRTSDELIGTPIKDISHPDDVEANRTLFEHLYATGESFVRDNRYICPDGSTLWALTSVSPIRDAGGRIVGGSAACIDISDRKHAENALRESEKHTKLLLAELQHRVRNTLAVVRSITRRTAATSETVEDYAMHLEGRIESFARTQAMATRSADAGVNLEEFVRDELLAHAVRDDEKAHIDGPPVRLQAKTAEAIGLAVHELATNAVKYGALSGDGGHIDVIWRIMGDDGSQRLRLEWRESGVSVATVAPRRRGFGSELIERTLRYELDAETELEFTPGGVRCTIEVPLNERTAFTGFDQHVDRPGAGGDDDQSGEREQN